MHNIYVSDGYRLFHSHNITVWYMIVTEVFVVTCCNEASIGGVSYSWSLISAPVDRSRSHYFSGQLGPPCCRTPPSYAKVKQLVLWIFIICLHTYTTISIQPQFSRVKIHKMCWRLGCTPNPAEWARSSFQVPHWFWGGEKRKVRNGRNEKRKRKTN